ncbi:MAG: peptidyl-prolyl cis-trans isomerase [Acidimicrobiia bacterium]
MIRTALSVVALMTVLAAAACGGDGDPEVAATVEGTTIGSSEIAALTETYLDTRPGQALIEDIGEDGVTKLVLSFEIKRLVLERLADEMGVKAEDAAVDDAYSVLAERESYRQAGFTAENLASAGQAARISKALAEEVFPEVSVTGDELARAYEERKKLFERSWRLGAQIAIFDSVEAANTLRRRVQAGTGFAEAAEALGPMEQGDIEVTPVSPLPQPILDAVGQLRQGDLSEPIPAGSIWAVVKVDRREDTPALNFDQVKDSLAAGLGDQKRQALFRDWFVKQLRAAQVRVDEAFGEWDAKAGIVT